MARNEIDDLLDQLFLQMQWKSGGVIKKRWVYTGDGCPGCDRKVDAVKIKKKKAMSLNVYIFREQGVLIAYMLCGKCATYIMEISKTQPDGPTPLHNEIEKNLEQAYLRRSGH